MNVGCKHLLKLLLFLYLVTLIVLAPITVKADELDIDSIIQDDFSNVSSISCTDNNNVTIKDNSIVLSGNTVKGDKKNLYITFKLQTKATINFDFTSSIYGEDELNLYIDDSNFCTVLGSYSSDGVVGQTNYSSSETKELNIGEHTFKIEITCNCDSVDDYVVIQNINFKRVIDDIFLDYKPTYTGNDYSESLTIGEFSQSKYKDLFFQSEDELPTIESYYVNGNNEIPRQLFTIEFVANLYGNPNRLRVFGSWKRNGIEIYTITFPETDRYESFVYTISVDMQEGYKIINYVNADTTTTKTYYLTQDINYGGKGWAFIDAEEKANYTFKGWSTTQDGSNIVTESDYQLSSKSWYSKNNITLYAIYEANTKQITMPISVVLDSNGTGSFTIQSEEITNEQSIYITLSDLTLTDQHGNSVNCLIDFVDEVGYISDKTYKLSSLCNVAYVNIEAIDLKAGTWSGKLYIEINMK